MQFRTEIKFDSPSFVINHHDKILSIGSCFAENIGRKLDEYKFNILSNPFGVLYNPASISNSIELAIQNKELSNDDFVFNQSEWHSFLHHSDFSSEDKNKLITETNSSFRKCHDFLLNVDIVIVTFGTANVYRYKKSGRVVSNCHKIPQSEFIQNLLTIDDVANYCNSIIENIISVQPQTKFIFSVSPVRHVKDGFIKNTKSKATLILGIEKAINNSPNCFYFPSFEIFIDDLRDYRFYKEDLVHPNDFAIEYVWNIFKEKMLSQKCKVILDEINPVVQAAKHRIRNPKSLESQKFIKQMLSKIQSLKNKFPYINFEREEKTFIEF